MVDRLIAGITKVISLWDRMKNAAKRAISEMGMGESEAFVPNATRSSNVNQSLVVNQKINGAGDPMAVGAASAEAINEVADTFYDSAVYSR